MEMPREFAIPDKMVYDIRALHKEGGGGQLTGHKPPPSCSSDRKLKWRSHRGITRRLARRLTPEYLGLQFCGTLRPLAEGEDYTGVQVRLTTDRRGEAHAYYHGLRYCGSPHVCPVCAERLARARSEEIAHAAAEWVAAGGRLILATFTLRHHGGEELEAVLGRLSRAWRRMVSSRAWKEQVHYAEYVRSLEVTWGRNGWHPHVHVLFFFWDEVPLSGDIFPLWERAVSAVDGEVVPEAFSWEEVSPADVAEVGRYVAKWGPGQELAGGVWKGGNAGGLSPWEILLLAGYQGGLIRIELCGHAVQHAQTLGIGLEEVDWMKLWREYTRGVRGLRSVSWSREAKGLFRVFTDEELLHREPEDSVVVGTLTIEEYLRLWHAGLDQDFLAAVETCGWDAALTILDLAPPLPSGWLGKREEEEAWNQEN